MPGLFDCDERRDIVYERSPRLGSVTNFPRDSRTKKPRRRPVESPVGEFALDERLATRNNESETLETMLHNKTEKF